MYAIEFLDHLAELFAAQTADHDIPSFDSCRTMSPGK